MSFVYVFVTTQGVGQIPRRFGLDLGGFRTATIINVNTIGGKNRRSIDSLHHQPVDQMSLIDWWVNRSFLLGLKPVNPGPIPLLRNLRP